MNRGAAEERKKRGKGGREHSPSTHFSHGRWHEKLWREREREATFKRSNHDYVKFWSAILPPPSAKHTPSWVASFFNWDLDGMVRGVQKEGDGVRNRFHRSRVSRKSMISKFTNRSSNSILFLLIRIPPRMMGGRSIFIRNSIKIDSTFFQSTIEHAMYSFSRERKKSNFDSFSVKPSANCNL